MDAYTFKIGTMDCVAVSDGDTDYDAADYVVNAPRDEVADALKAHGHQPDRTPSPYSGLVRSSPRTWCNSASSSRLIC
jgi:hypothetical protein